MAQREISPEIESTILLLAGNWAKDGADEGINLAKVEKWEEAFNERFNFYYASLLEALDKARESGMHR
jgi:hypothetical protein